MHTKHAWLLRGKLKKFEHFFPIFFSSLLERGSDERGCGESGTVYSEQVRVRDCDDRSACRLVADPEAPDAADADADGWSRDGREELLVDVDVR